MRYDSILFDLDGTPVGFHRRGGRLLGGGPGRRPGY